MTDRERILRRALAYAEAVRAIRQARERRHAAGCTGPLVDTSEFARMLARREKS